MNKTRGLKRFLAISLVVVMAMAVVAMPIFAIPEYRTGANEVSDAYKGGQYYQNVMNVPLSGDGVTDVLAVAMSQMGYSEGNSLDAMSGTNKGSSNYTEFYYNFGKVTDTWSVEWDAAFCSWALYQSGVSDQSTVDDLCSNHPGDIDYIWREINSAAWAEQLDKVGLYSTRESEYKPASGDLIFFKQSTGINRMGIVVWCDESTETVYTIEGNTNSGSGLDGNGGGVYYKSYALSNASIHGYGSLPYERTDAPKVDYSGKTKTAGFYMAKAEFWISSLSDGELDYKIPQYDMFKVTGFDGQYAMIEHGDGKYYGLLNSNMLQITANDGHSHSFGAGNDETHHYRTCECGEKINSVEHSYTLEYKDTEHHEAKCSCGYVKDTVEHTFTYVVDGDRHKLACDCGYVKTDSDTVHVYDVLDSNENGHFYRCECGDIDMQSFEAHSVTKHFDENNHFDACEKCGRAVEGTEVPHTYGISTDFNVCECGYDRSNEDEHSWVIAYNGDKHYQICEDCQEIREKTESAHDFENYSNEGEHHVRQCACGYADESSAAAHVYDRFGYPKGEEAVHMQMCVCGSFLEGTEEAHYYEKLASDADGHWFECVCGFKSGFEEHTKVDGVCTECKHHVHSYRHNTEGHWTACDDAEAYFEEHTMKSGECSVCGYNPEALCEHTAENGSCSECGYHWHAYAHNDEGHWTVCDCPLAKRELVAHLMSDGKCEICGYNTARKTMHKLVNGTCTECGYHEHVYIYDITGHKNVCDCYLSGDLEKHTLKNGDCSICCYNANGASNETDGEKVKVLYDGEPVKGVSPKGCSSAIGVTSAVFGAVMMLGCAVAVKKKENE